MMNLSRKIHPTRDLDYQNNGESMGDICARLPRHLPAVVSIALVLAHPATGMAHLVTLRLPGITGDVTVGGQQGTIEVLSLSGTIQVSSI
jgi:hypothetical protein